MDPEDNVPVPGKVDDTDSSNQVEEAAEVTKNESLESASEDHARNEETTIDPTPEENPSSSTPKDDSEANPEELSTTQEVGNQEEFSEEQTSQTNDSPDGATEADHESMDVDVSQEEESTQTTEDEVKENLTNNEEETESLEVKESENPDVIESENPDVDESENPDVEESENPDVNKSENPEDDTSEHSDGNNPDESPATTNAENTVQNEETEPMEVDSTDAAGKSEDSVLETSLNQSVDPEEIQRTEEVDMENVEETQEKEGGDDPFDSLRQNTSITSDKSDELDNTQSVQDTSTMDETAPDTSTLEETADETTAMDDSVIDTSATDQPSQDTTALNETTTTVDEELNKTVGNDDSVTEEAAKTVEDGTDDLERGKGVDEELSLLPDAERELTEADMERALQAEQEDESAVVEDDSPVDGAAVDNEDQTTSKTADQLNESTTENDIVESAALKADEIKELQGELVESKCIQCNEMRPGQFTLLHNSETAFLCSTDCVAAFRSTNATYTLTVKRVIITVIADSQQSCKECTETKPCKFRLPKDTGFEYLCDDACLTKLMDAYPELYTVKRKRYTIEEITETAEPFECIQCSESKKSRFSFKQDNQVMYVCHDNCLNLLMIEQPDRFRIKRRSVRVRDLPKRAGHGSATIEDPSAQPTESADAIKMLARNDAEVEAARLDREASFIRRCTQCFTVVVPNERSLHWETLDFCNETCLGQYQHVIGAACTTCHGSVQMTSLGKYCVRFGYEIRQFCRSSCLDEFKKGLKVCSYCQMDISKDENGFLASIGGQFKDFCRPQCMRKYDEMCNPKKKAVTGVCRVCNNVDQIRVEVTVNGHSHTFCSNPCFSAFQFVNNISADKCQMCQKYFERHSIDPHTIYQSGNTTPLMYCSKVCMNIYIITHRKIVPCQWCKVKKYNFDMIQKYSGGKTSIMLCSLNCLTLCEVSMNAISMKRQQCDKCLSMTTPQYHLTMSDATIRNFCTYQCVMSFQSQFSRAPLTLEGQMPQAATNAPIPTGLPKRIKSVQTGNANQTPSKATTSVQSNASPATGTTNNKTTKAKNKVQVKPAKINNTPQTNNLVISNVTSLASGITTRNRKGFQPVVELEPLPMNVLRKATPNSYGKKAAASTAEVAPAPEPLPPPPPKIEIRTEVKTQIVTIPPVPKRVSNMATMCHPTVKNVETQCRPKTATIGCQTEAGLEKTVFIPIPVPIYVPQPMHMYSLPYPVPVPFPLPIPVPVFIPTTRNSAHGIMKEIKKIQDKMPTDPFEAELLMMAEMVAGDKKKNDSDSGSDDDRDDDYGTTAINDGAALGEDMLQMALKMAQEYEAPAVDLERSMTATTITPEAQPPVYRGDIAQHHLMTLQQQTQRLAIPAVETPPQRGRKRGSPGQTRNARSAASTPPSKRVCRQDIKMESPVPEPPREPVEKADANMCLKFTFGVNAWKQWVMTKNADLEKSSIRRKPFKSELLQLTADELNYSLCLFVKEVRKPNGSEYAPDTIYYLVLGIQQYLYENGRIDNIFTDPYYERFTDCLDEVAKKFSVLYNDSQYIVTRVEEEHLWECKQLGAHSPHVLLSTLMFFNTKHFNLTSVDEHMQLSFSHIMKHWKRNPNQVSGQAKAPGSRNVLLRFYPPQASLEGNSRKKKVYEQQENEENPLRCPVKLYEFYLSKCPESVKTRNDVFYLQPERSCVPDSPVWYSTQPLVKDSLSKMLHRVKMVKEINIALLTS